jgi:hypothetical protein
MSCRLRRLLPTNAWVRLAAAPALAFVALASDRQYLMDFWHHLARGRAMAEQGRLIDHDLFTYTVAGQSFQDVNWLTQLAYHHLYQHGGLGLVQLVNALATAATLTWLVLLCRRKSGSLAAAAAVGVFTFFGLWQVLTIRPQTFSLLLFVLLYDLLDRAEQRRAWLLVPPFILALWANVHGAFPAGLLLLGCVCLGAAWQAWRRLGNPLRDGHTRALALCLAASTLATLVNPYGWAIYEYVGQTSSRAAARGIQEWLPPRLEMLVGMGWALSMALLTLLAAAAWRRGWRPAAREVFLVLCFLPLACGSVRMVVWWLIVFAPLCASLLARVVPGCAPAADGGRPSWGAALVLGLVVLVAVVSVPGLERYNPLLGFRPRERAVENALEAAHQRVAARVGSGRVFSRFEWGEYLSWAGAPAFPVYMDGRIEIIPDDIWERYIRLTRGEDGWQKVLDDYQVDYLVLDAEYHRANGLLTRVEQSAGWQRLWQGEAGVVVFERLPSPAVAATHPRRAAGP